MWAALNSNFWAAILGAFVGGAISLIAQAFERQAANRDRDAQDLQRRIALYASILAKLTQLHRIVSSMAKHQMAGRNQASPNAEPWSYTRPIAALPPPGRFSDAEAAELWLLDSKLFTEVLLYADRVHVAVETHERYSSERTALVATLSAGGMNGLHGAVAFDDGFFTRTAQHRAALNDLCESSFRYNIEDADKGLNLLRQLVEAVNVATGSTWSVAPSQVSAVDAPTA